MGQISTLAEVFLRNYVVDGVPASGVNNPAKADGLTTFNQVDVALSYLSTFSAVGVMYATQAAMNADLAHAAGTPALVYNDPAPANNAVYVKVGASGSGSWATTGITFPNSADINALIHAVPIHSHTCQVAQLKMQLVTNGTFQQVSNAIPPQPSNPINQQWTGGGFITPAGPLGVQVGATLGLTTTALQSLFDTAAAAVV